MRERERERERKEDIRSYTETRADCHSKTTITRECVYQRERRRKKTHTDHTVTFRYD